MSHEPGRRMEAPAQEPQQPRSWNVFGDAVLMASNAVRRIRCGMTPPLEHAGEWVVRMPHPCIDVGHPQKPRPSPFIPGLGEDSLNSVRGQTSHIRAWTTTPFRPGPEK